MVIPTAANPRNVDSFIRTPQSGNPPLPRPQIDPPPFTASKPHSPLLNFAPLTHTSIPAPPRRSCRLGTEDGDRTRTGGMRRREGRGDGVEFMFVRCFQGLYFCSVVLRFSSALLSFLLFLCCFLRLFLPFLSSFLPTFLHSFPLFLPFLPFVPPVRSMPFVCAF